jgi:acyl-CoA dehydrogenase
MNPDLIALIDEIATGGHAARSDTDFALYWPTLLELGLGAIGVPEEQGGAGGTLDDLVTVTRSLSRHGIDLPLPERALASWLAAGSTQQLPAVAVVTELSATELRTKKRLTNVVWAPDSSRLVIAGPSGTFAVDTSAATVSVSATPWALGALFHDVEFGADFDFTGLVELPSTAPVVEVECRLSLLVAARLVGAVDGAYRLSRTYVSQREQFGKPLIKIPAVAQNLARVRILLTEAETALDRATAALQADPANRHAVAVARIVSSRSATAAAQICHQLHGAMGVTAEYSLGRYTRMLWAWRDAGTAQSSWSTWLGAQVMDAGEIQLWDRITATV